MKCVGAVILFLFFVLVSVQAILAVVPPVISIIRADSTQVLFGEHLAPLPHQGTSHSDLLVDNGRFGVYYYRSGANFDTLPFLKFDSVNSTELVDPGDIDGDGFDDIGLVGRSPFGWKYNVYLGGPNLDTIRDMWFGLDTILVTNPAHVCKNLKGNSLAYLVAFGSGPTYGNVTVFDLSSPMDSSPVNYLRPVGIPPINSTQLGRDIAYGDYNGDGVTDIAANLTMGGSATRSGEVWIYFGGTDFDTVPSLVLRRNGPFQTSYNTFGENVECPGDLNGDGFDDLIVCGAGVDTMAFVYYGGNIVDTLPSFYFGPNAEFIKSAGDINGDGYPDFLLCTPSVFSGGGKVRLYYGGPNMDGISDLTIHDWEIPGYHTGFGYGCTGVGDFNGDGSNDFAFSLYDNQSRGWVYVFSGQKSGTDVNSGTGRTFPTSFALHPAFPNPFNPSTTISFDLPKRAGVKLVVFDVIGREVKKLVDQEMTAGAHSVSWDGTNDAGKAVASGVYFFKMSSGEFEKSVKGMLVK